MIKSSRTKNTIKIYKLKRTATAFLLLCFMLLTIVFISLGNVGLSANAQSGTVNAQGFAGGDGSTNSPFLIATAEQLDNVRNHKFNKELYENSGGIDYEGYHFKLIANIDLSTFIELNYPEEGWNPIAGNYFDDDNDYTESYYPFKGTFNGDGHTISGLWTDRGGKLAGLFGAAQAIFSNLNLEIDEKGVNGVEYAGGLVAYLLGRTDSPSSITRCSVRGKVSLTDTVPKTKAWESPNGCGGIVGYIDSIVTVSESYFTGVLTNENCGDDNDAIGGIAGITYDSTFSNCYAKVEIILDEKEPSRFAAGIIGRAEGSAAITNCCAVTVCEYPVAPVITCVNASPMINTKPLVAYNNYYCNNIIVNTDAVTDDGIMGLSIEEMRSKSSFAGWDFETVWGFDKDGNLILRPFGVAYDPLPPFDLTWLWITLGCTLFGVVAIAAGAILYRRKKTEIINVTNTVRETVYVQTPIQHLPESLTVREHEVAELILEGYSRSVIGKKLFISESTVKKHIKSVFEKTGCTSQKEFIVKFK